MARRRKPLRRSPKRQQRSRDIGHSTPLSFDQLESRHLLATLVVNSTADGPVDFTDSEITIREAIQVANDTIGADTITFDSGVFTGGNSSLIRLTAGELEITDTLTIDGSTSVDVTITGDALGDDELVDGTFITDVAAILGENRFGCNRSRPCLE